MRTRRQNFPLAFPRATRADRIFRDRRASALGAHTATRSIGTRAGNVTLRAPRLLSRGNDNLITVITRSGSGFSYTGARRLAFIPSVSFQRERTSEAKKKKKRHGDLFTCRFLSECTVSSWVSVECLQEGRVGAELSTRWYGNSCIA